MMLWNSDRQYQGWPFDKEAEVEAAILESRSQLFGDDRIYIDVKKLIGQSGKTRNIPDGYLLDLASRAKPLLYLVEVELATHDPLRHVAQQLLEFSLSFKTTPQRMKSILRDTIRKSPEALAKCEQYAAANGFSNMDYLLEQMIYPDDAFRALVIIDELEDELEKILSSSLKFPVEVLTLQRFRSNKGDVLYQFEPFLYDLSIQVVTAAADIGNTPAVDPAELDTIVVPAREEGFRDVFMGENMWRALRIHPSMLPKLKHLAVYQVAPESAITHVVEIDRIEPWKDTGKYAVRFKAAPQRIDAIKWVPNGRVMAPQSARYTSYAKLRAAHSLDEVF